MINAGAFKYRIRIYQITRPRDAQGFNNELVETEILQPYAAVKTTKGFTLITANSDFEKAYTNFTIRYSQTVIDAYYDSDDSNRDMLIQFRNKTYKVEYLNNIDEANVLLEMQAKEVMH